MKKVPTHEMAAVKISTTTSPKLLQQQIDAYEREKKILLALSNDITKVREKNDLIRIFSEHIQKLF